MNLQKSKLPLPVPRNEALRIEADTKNLRLVEEGINAKGEPFKLTISAGFDGKHYGVLASPSVDTVWSRRLDNYTIIGNALKSGTEVKAGTALVSKNGKTLTVTLTGTTKGKEIKARAVFDKQ